MPRYELRERRVLDVVDTEDDDNAITTFREEETQAAKDHAAALEALHEERLRDEG